MFKTNHSISEISLHLVLVTKYRKPYNFDSTVIQSAVTSAKCNLEKIGIANNHVHLLIAVPVTKSVAKIVEIIKSISSKKFAKLTPGQWPFWQVGFYVSSVGRSSRSKVISYLDQQ